MFEIDNTALAPVFDESALSTTQQLEHFMQVGFCFIKLPEIILHALHQIQAAAIPYFYLDEATKELAPYQNGDGYLNQAKKTSYNIQRYIYRNQLLENKFADIAQAMDRVKAYLHDTIFNAFMSLIFNHLGLSHYLAQSIDQATESISLLFYPAEQQDDMRLTPHKDTVALTALWAPQAGFEANINDNWHAIEPNPAYLGVQVGKTLEIMTDGACHALEHRVSITQGVERFSLASFFALADDMPLVNFKSGEIISNRYGDYLNNDVKQTYAKK